jgi:hypothetical protein
MIAVPLLAWSRFQIPSGSIPAAQMEAVRVHLQAHVLAADAKLGLCDILYSPDQLPQSYVDTAQLAEKLAKAAIHGRNLKIDPAQLAETMSFLSDTRYLLGAVAAPRGAPLFRWQEDDGDPAESFRQWAQQGGEALRPLLPACAIEFLPVLAYHAAVRDADRASRPWSLRAAVAFLQTVLNQPASELRAVVAPFHDRQLEEFRIGFTQRGSSDVVHGVVWPLLEQRRRKQRGPGTDRSHAAGSRRPQRAAARPALPAGVLRRLRRAAVSESRRRAGACRTARRPGRVGAPPPALRSRRRKKSALAGRRYSEAVSAASRPGSRPGDQIGQQARRTAGQRPAQRAVAGVEPQPRQPGARQVADQRHIARRRRPQPAQ